MLPRAEIVRKKDREEERKRKGKREKLIAVKRGGETSRGGEFQRRGENSNAEIITGVTIARQILINRDRNSTVD